MLIFPEISWFSNQAQAVIHVYCKPPFHIFRDPGGDPGKVDEICLLEISMQIHPRSFPISL
jgi:hypothetical protein